MTDTVCYWCGAKDTLADIVKEIDDGKYKMVKCSKCKNAYYVVNKEKMNKPKPMTNEEYLRSLNTEQLAETILQQWIHGAYHGVGEFGLTDKEIESARDDIVEWLKEIHK